MNNKPLMTEILRDWYFIDSVLLNGHAKKIIKEEKLYNEYISIKRALLSNLFEFYNHIHYSPSKTLLPNNDRLLQEDAIREAKKSKNIASRMLQEKEFVDSLKKTVMTESKNVKNQSIREFSDKIINSKFLQMVLDNTLIGEPIIRAKSPDRSRDFNGQIYENAYNLMRNSLLKICEQYNPLFGTVKEGIMSNPNTWKALGYGLIAVAGFKLAGAVGRQVQTFASQCHNRCGSFRLTTDAKRICMLKCEIEVHRKIIASLRSAAAANNNEEARDQYARDVRRAQMKIAKLSRQLAPIEPRNVVANPDIEANETGPRLY